MVTLFLIGLTPIGLMDAFAVCVRPNTNEKEKGTK